jgi:hypothetical protein
MLDMNILICTKCGIALKEAFFGDGDICPRSGCSGTVEYCDVRLLEPIVELNSKGYCTKKAIMDVPYSVRHEADIFIQFCDDYGNSFTALPPGFNLIGSNPEKNRVPTPISLIRKLDPTLSKSELFIQFAQGAIDLMVWARSLP